MASTHHAAAQHSRYPLITSANTRDEFRLPSLKDLNFQYQPRGPSSHESPQHPSAGPIDTSLNGQDNAPRHVQSWNRANVQPQSPPAMPMHHQHQHQHQQQHPHQQHTPPLSAGHEPPSSKVEYTSKQDNGGFLTPGMPLSAQSTPVPGSLNIGPGTRSDEGAHGPSQAKRRRSSANMGTPRDVRTPHVSFTFSPVYLLKFNVAHLLDGIPTPSSATYANHEATRNRATATGRRRRRRR